MTGLDPTREMKTMSDTPVDSEETCVSSLHRLSGIRNPRAARRYLRGKFSTGLPEPVVSRPGALFYVTLQAGRRSAFLLGPYVSHMTALAAVPRAREMLGARGLFASVGTASTPRRLPTVFGR